MEDIFKEEIFSIVWKVENFHLSIQTLGNYLETPNFVVKQFQNTMWKLLLAPEAMDPLFIGCALARVSSDEEPDIVRLRWKVCIISEGGVVRFETTVKSVFTHNKYEILQQFIRKSDLLPTDTPLNNLTIHCEMRNDPLYSATLDSKFDFESLSLDLEHLLESGFRSDFKMYCRGEIFNVHKFILISRWEKISENLDIDFSARDDIIMTDIEASTLKSLLTFLYTGKLQRKDMTMELYSYMHEQYLDDLLENLETPVSRVEYVTHMNHEWKQLTWEVGDEDAWKEVKLPFFRVIPLESVYPSEMVIIFNFEKIDGIEWLKLVMFLTGFSITRPIRLYGDISFMNKNATVSSRKFNHLLEENEEWSFPTFVKKSELLPNPSNSKTIEIELSLCDGNLDAQFVSSTIDNASRFKEVKNLRELVFDFVHSDYKKDAKLIMGEHAFNVHSTLLAARSEKLAELIEQNHGVVEIEGSFSRQAAKSFFNHLLGGRLMDLDIISIQQLNSIAKEFSLASLEEKTERMLSSSHFHG